MFITIRRIPQVHSHINFFLKVPNSFDGVDIILHTPSCLSFALVYDFVVLVSCFDLVMLLLHVAVAAVSNFCLPPSSLAPPPQVPASGLHDHRGLWRVAQRRGSGLRHFLSGGSGRHRDGGEPSLLRLHWL